MRPISTWVGSFPRQLASPRNFPFAVTVMEILNQARYYNAMAEQPAWQISKMWWSGGERALNEASHLPRASIVFTVRTVTPAVMQ